MKPKELKSVIKLKNDIIMEQSKRIRLLEDKVSEIRKEYFRLKYSDSGFNLQQHWKLA